MSKTREKIERDIDLDIEAERWGKIVISAQLIIACVVCAIEILNNVLLYVTRSQGYGPDTIVEKLIRYLLITSIINFGVVFLSWITEKRVEDETSKRFFLMLYTTIICTDVAFSHYQFATTLAIFIIPIVISILYESRSLSLFTLLVSLVGQTIAIIARAVDPLYNKDIGPEAAIAVSLSVSTWIFARMISSTLAKRRTEVKDAVIQAEKAHSAAERMAFSFKMLETLASTLDAKDKYTNGHSLRVAIYATKLATAMGWEQEQIAQLRYEALLHDIGKIGVPDVILNKPTKLSEVEFGLIKSHTVIGSDILKNMVAVPNASEVAKYHHERYDGKGYPSGIAGEDIPVNARIVCIADSYDAMNSDRIYRKALARDVIRQELVKGRGTQFDPEMLDAFLLLFDEYKLGIDQDDFYVSEAEAKQKFVLEDIENMLGRLTSFDEQRTSIGEFDKFYKYMRNIGLRYGRSIEVLSIDLLRKDGREVYEDMEDISDLLQMAIRKNIRSVDVYYRYSQTRHMLILLDAGVDNIDVVQNRILFDFESNLKSKDFRLEFCLNESIDAPEKHH